MPLPDGGTVRRRVVIVSRSALNRRLKPVVADITTTVRERSLPTYVEVEPDPRNGLTEVSFIVCHELATVEWATLQEPIGRLDVEPLFALREALAIAVGVKELPEAPP